MAMNEKFPESPYVIINPKHRWFPADESLRDTSYEKLVPPLVPKIREEVYEWRKSNYEGASNTSKILLQWWFNYNHPNVNLNGIDGYFQYYFSQREAVESVIYLYEIAKVRNKLDLMKFDKSGYVSSNMFFEDWLRFVIKMATGSGKTKVISLLIAWSYFHKLYEEGSELSRNFLLIAPNIIVLERLKNDFEGLKIFYHDPILPENGYFDQNWQSDFNLNLHIQDQILSIRTEGNIFLTNIHRVYKNNDKTPSEYDEDSSRFFLGNRPISKTTDSRVDLLEIIKDIDELMIINDEAHHIHDNRLAWFQSIEEIHKQFEIRGKKLSLQLDVTATPKHSNGSIFVQTISDYGLVEAITQNVVKRPIIPDEASRAKLHEKKTDNYIEKYADYIHLGVEEWRKTYQVNIKLGKKSILFIMADDTSNCDIIANYLESRYPDLQNSVLTIHTNRQGEIKENITNKGNKEELEKLRKQAKDIDRNDSPYKVIVSVLMLKEGWDVNNVTTVVGLRAYSAKSNILPEQTLGRGLRKMYFNEGIREYLSVVGTDAFIDFVESIKTEGVELETAKMGEGAEPKAPTVIEIDTDNKKKDLENLNIIIPILNPKITREYKNLSHIDVRKINDNPIKLKKFSLDEQKEIIFRDIANGEITHSTILNDIGFIDARGVVSYIANNIMRGMRLISAYDIIYSKLKEFIENYLFTENVSIDDPNVVRNLSDIEIYNTIFTSFKTAVNELTIVDNGEAEIKNYIDLLKVRPFTVRYQTQYSPKKSIFNKIIGDSHFELEFAKFLDDSLDVIAFAKNYFAIHFKLDYINADGDISHYYPDFIVRIPNNKIYIIETKGFENLDDPLKVKRLKLWCNDINNLQTEIKYDYLFVDQKSFESSRPKSFQELILGFKKYR